MDNILHMIGLALRAGRLEVGEEPVGAACRARDCRLILVARDAADNSFRRVRHFADAGQCLWVSVPYTKEELGRAAEWALHVYFGGMFMLGMQFSCQQTFVALGQAKVSLFLALLRKVILLVPLSYGGYWMLGEDNVLRLALGLSFAAGIIVFSIYLTVMELRESAALHD